jgi:hypothetical protein
MTAYDKAKWHYGAEDFPPDLPREQGFVHTGLFVGWLIERGLLGPDLLEESPDFAEWFRSRSKTGPQVFQLMDGVLTDDDLTEEGNAFAGAYFDFQTGVYLQDYEELLSGHLATMYHVQDTWSNYDVLRDRIDERFAQWKRGDLPRVEGERVSRPEGAG